MTYFKYIKNGYILTVGKSPKALYEEITEEEYNKIKRIASVKPDAPEGYDYRLKTDLTWELYALPESEPADNDPELSAEEALDIIVNGGNNNA